MSKRKMENMGGIIPAPWCQSCGQIVQPDVTCATRRGEKRRFWRRVLSFLSRLMGGKFHWA